MLKYLYNPGSANLPSAEPWASVMICCAGKGVWEPGTGPLATATRYARTWICLSQALDDMPSSRDSPSLSSSVPDDMVQGFSGWAVDKTNRSTRLFAFRYLPRPLSRAHRRCMLRPRARFLMLVRTARGAAARGDTQHDNRIFNTQDKRHLFPSGLGQLVGHRSSHTSVPEASNYNKICLAQISAEDDASAAGSPSAGTQLHFFQPPTIQDTLPNGAARWAGRGACVSGGCGWLGTLLTPSNPKGCFPSRITGAVPRQAHLSFVQGLDGAGSGRRHQVMRQHMPT